MYDDRYNLYCNNECCNNLCCIPGPQGPAGCNATIAVGSVITGAPGSPAIVTNSGTATNAVLNFVIPRGATGTTGATGPTGAYIYAKH